MRFFQKWFDANERILKSYKKSVELVNSREQAFCSMTNQELQQMAGTLRQKSQADPEDPDLLVESFALVREAAKRTLGMRPFDVQLVGALCLHEGKVAEMKTGEGKTLVATLPVFLNALHEKGVHMVTVNDYLARRDATWMAPLYLFLGLSLGVINTQNTSFSVEWKDPDAFARFVEQNRSIWPQGGTQDIPDPDTLDKDAAGLLEVQTVSIDRKQALEKEVVYGTNNEFGFDYLRDNLVYDPNAKVQRNHFFAIVDEVDSILIDEARTPLIISGPTQGTAQAYRKFANWTAKFQKDRDFTMDEKSRTLSLTDEGVKKAEGLLKIENLYDPSQIDNLYHFTNALTAEHFYKRDVHYIVTDSQEVVIVDEFTGRLMPGRRFSGGLHQALEAKEKANVQEESITYASITFQNFFRMYDKLAGMTGTAKTEEEEFQQIYNMDVVVIPTNMPVVRDDTDDQIYRTVVEKYQAILGEVKECYEKKQPVLVGTTSIEKSELVSGALKKMQIPHQVLNAKYHEQEAEIIANAGEPGTITIATNMAGRGTDIKLGAGVKQLGGLYVIGTERHEARRIDNQLRGRSGRQGDPGKSRFFLSVEDDLVRIFGGDKIGKIMDMLKIEEGEPIFHPMLTRLVEQAQKKVEGMHFSVRKYLLELDTVMDVQRKEIYEHRDWILSEADMETHMREIYQEVVDRKVSLFTTGTDWDFEGLKNSLKVFPLAFEGLRMESFDTPDQLRTFLEEALLEAYSAKKEEIGEKDFLGLQKYLLLRIIDERWRNHLENIEKLKEGINLRAYGQKDPVMEFKRESRILFEEMIDSIYDDIASLILRVARVNYQDATASAQKEVDALRYTHDEFDTFNRKKRRKVEAKSAKSYRRMKVKR